jgi:hypothetical protein
VNLGTLDLYALMTQAVRSAMMACWYHKWNFMKLRPEELGMQIHSALADNRESLLHADILLDIHRKHGSYLLPQAYPEGTPCHPSYPSGHAVFARATTTILKAFYDGGLLSQ